MKPLLLLTLLLTGCQNARQAREIDRVLGLPMIQIQHHTL